MNNQHPHQQPPQQHSEPQQPPPQGYQQPGQHQPMAPGQPPRGLAVTALVIGIIAIFTGWVPVLGAVFGVPAIIFGAVALKKRQPKGFALTGLILGAIATIASIIAAIMLFAFTSNVLDEFETAFEEMTIESIDPAVEGEGEITADEELDSDIGFGDVDDLTPGETIPWDHYDTAEVPLSQNAGTAEDPHVVGTRIESTEWEIVVNSINSDASEELLALAPDTPPAADGKRYVLVHVTVNNTTGEPAETRRLEFYYTTPNQIYPARTSKATAPEPAGLEGGLQVTGNYSAYIAFLTKDVDGEGFSVRHESFPSEQYFAAH